MNIFNTFFNKSTFIITVGLLISFSLNSTALAAEKSFNKADFAHWLDAAYIADASYKSKEQITQVLVDQHYKLQIYKQLDGYSVAYFIATNDETKQHIIAVRGTANVENVIVDAAFVLVPDKITGIDIHQGFLLSSRDIYQQITAELKPGYKITTIGHSLGGATAIILAMMLDAQGYDINEVITFGQPKVTNISGSQKFSHLNVTRLVTAKDLVPLVPPADPMDMMKLSIFWHQGTEIILYEKNQYAVLSGMKSMLRTADFLNDVPSEQHINNHFMTTYITLLKPKLITANEVEYESDFSFSDWFGSSSKN